MHNGCKKNLKRNKKQMENLVINFIIIFNSYNALTLKVRQESPKGDF